MSLAKNKQDNFDKKIFVPPIQEDTDNLLSLGGSFHHFDTDMNLYNLTHVFLLDKEYHI